MDVVTVRHFSFFTDAECTTYDTCRAACIGVVENSNEHRSILHARETCLDRLCYSVSGTVGPKSVFPRVLWEGADGGAVNDDLYIDIRRNVTAGHGHPFRKLDQYRGLLSQEALTARPWVQQLLPIVFQLATPVWPQSVPIPRTVKEFVSRCWRLWAWDRTPAGFLTILLGRESLIDQEEQIEVIDSLRIADLERVLQMPWIPSFLRAHASERVENRIANADKDV